MTGEEKCPLCRTTYSIFENFPDLPTGMALNVETGRFFPLAMLRSYQSGYEMTEALGTAWACRCRESIANRFDEQFTLQDAKGLPVTNTYYTIESLGRLVHGVTDSSGRTRRHRTEGAKAIRIYLGHRNYV
ncbi:hypothetical protein [Paraburkholderia ferrariae]|uniref:hypothetical protein n=1 Tax=Paraburkholderia ferrariae TaxID=386056 RepID=UPI0009FD8BB4|nr:hypothetical protein [Paraburkholderia ferrariae]